MMRRIFLKEYLGNILFVVGVLPLFWFVGVFLFYIRARTYLGFWPNSHIPDPKSLPFELHHWIFMILVFPVLLSILIVPVLWFIKFKTTRIHIRNEVLPYLLGWALVACTMMIPGTDFITWFLD